MSTRNDIRAGRAQTALQSSVEAQGEVFEISISEIADLMADLLHLAIPIEEGEEAVERCLRLARIHFDAEHNNPEEEAACPASWPSAQACLRTNTGARACSHSRCSSAVSNSAMSMRSIVGSPSRARRNSISSISRT
jgi:hypothetical protein